MAAAILAAPAGESRELEQAIDAFLARLSVRPIRNSRLVTVSVASGRPELAARATNALATPVHRAEPRPARARPPPRPGKWLGTQIEEQRRKVEQLDGQLQASEAPGGARQRRGAPHPARAAAQGARHGPQRAQDRAAPEGGPLAPDGRRAEPRGTAGGDAQRGRPVAADRAGEPGAPAGAAPRPLPRPAPRGGQGPQPDRRDRARSCGARPRASCAPRRTTTRPPPHRRRASPSALEAAKLETLDLAQAQRRVRLAEERGRRRAQGARQPPVALARRPTSPRSSSRRTSASSTRRPCRSRPVRPEAPAGHRARPHPRPASSAPALAFFLDYLDNTLKTPDDVRQHLGVAAPGRRPGAAGAPEQSLVLSLQHAGPVCRGLPRRAHRPQLLLARAGPRASSPSRPPRPARARPSPPSTSRDPRRRPARAVLLIDADLRKPQTHVAAEGAPQPRASPTPSWARPSPRPHPAELGDVPFAYLPCGTTVPSPADLLTTPRPCRASSTASGSSTTGSSSTRRRLAPWPRR